MKQLAIIGPTASGKSNLALYVAKKIDAYILSIDSLSIFKEIDIISAKVSKDELKKIKHFGIDVLCPDEHFSVDIFINLYKEVVATCKTNNKNLIIVGGTSFYLKSLIQGLSSLPKINNKTKLHVEKQVKNLPSAYEYLKEKDKEYMQKISPNDSYRIEKALLIYEASNQTPSEWFKNNPPKPIIKNLNIYNIEVDRDILRHRIKNRTTKMLEDGAIDEVCFLEQKYTRLPNSMGSIGIVEILDYLDGKLSFQQMQEDISIHTAQLAKRQQTFNKTQFKDITHAPLEKLEDIILQNF